MSNFIKMRTAVSIVICLQLAVVKICFASSPFSVDDSSFTGAEQCFCQLQGEVDDCSCNIEHIDAFNNGKIFPILNSLLQKDYFRYWKVNLKKECPFWEDNNMCTMTDCTVHQCSEEELPLGLKDTHKKPSDKYSEEANVEQKCSEELGEDQEGTLGELDSTLSDALKDAVETWQKHDDAQNAFCEMDDEKSSDADFVDLSLNPERYTGYKGQGASKIWGSIYFENCFRPEKMDYSTYSGNAQQKSGLAVEAMCIEKRTFFRMISGLHTSINVHLSAMYRNADPLGIRPPTWGANLQEFQRRFDPQTTNGDGPQRLRNLYFAYLVELRALAKVSPYLRQESFYTGNEVEDKETRKAVHALLDVIDSFGDHFDESRLFKGDAVEAAALKEDVRLKFHNISRIMDCVGCQKCRLWGKLQVTGMGTALKILFSGDDIGPQSTIAAPKENKGTFQLRRQEIVALFNAFGRFTKSIIEIEQFRKLMKEER